jgi:hypothetical protein
MDLLKLAALDEEDLSILSAHLQDAVIRIGDIRFLPAQNRFALVANRFDWQDGRKDGGMRRRCGVHFNRVRSVQSRNVRQGADDAILSLLAIEFRPGKDAPEGHVELTLSGNGSIRLEVECIEAKMEDLGPMWETGNVPTHDGDNAG